MTTIFQQTVTCGHCGTENEVIELGMLISTEN